MLAEERFPVVLMARDQSQTGVSDLADLLNRVFSSNSETESFAGKLLKRISIAADEAAELNEDSDEYSMVPPEAKALAEKFVGSIPEWLSFPQIFSDHRGRIGFSWKDLDQQRALYASFTPKKEIVWSYIDGKKEDGGKSLLDDALTGNLRTYLFSFKELPKVGTSKP